ncbi:hypothetical protein PSACC_00731 [Paramicrosporidium saccamoebae]|uniref:Uncharacterized protein n=1 Tax=Paramicrosporidium saccamoebae TaxID=1246581 RepID=A0A2H9TP06_9FUNG|nr:hypothetical protein PSACC_00731 [Paramicrosporidium saccamoebae]
MQKSFSTVHIVGPVGFLQYIRRIAEGRTVKPLNRALMRAGSKPGRMEVLAHELIRQPELWLKGADKRDVEMLVRECLNVVPAGIYLQLLKTILHLSHKNMSDCVRIILNDLVIRKDWELIKPVLMEFRDVGLVVPMRVLNLLLMHVSKLKETQHFLDIYECLRMAGYEPNAMTYSIVVIWNSMRSSVPLPNSSFAEGKMEDRINSLIGRAVNLDAKELNGVVTDTGSLRPLKTPVEPLALSIDSARDFRQALPTITTNQLFEFLGRVNSSIITASDLGYFVSHFLARADIDEATCSKLWRFVESREEYGSSVVFARLLPEWQRKLLFKSYIRDNSCSENVRDLVQKEMYGRAHSMVLETGARNYLQLGKPKISCQLLKAAVINGLLPIESALFNSTILELIKSGNAPECMDLLECLLGSGVKLSHVPWNSIIRTIFDHGRSIETLKMLDLLNENETIPYTTKIYANMLLIGEMDRLKAFISTKLPALAKQDSNALGIALESLIRRKQLGSVPMLLKAVLQESPSLARPDHYALAIQAAALGHDRCHLGYFRDLLSRQSKVFGLIKRSITTLDYSVLDSTSENQALGLAALLVHFFDTNSIRKFEKAFYRLFGDSLLPSHDTVRVFLSMKSDHGEGPLKSPDWGPLFVAWMERRGLKPNNAIFAKFLRLATTRKDSSLAEYVIKAIVSGEVVLTASISKELMSYIMLSGTVAQIVQVLEILRTKNIQLSASQYERIILLAVSHSDHVQAMEWAKSSIEEGRRISRKTTADLLDSIYRSWPLSSFLPILDYFHSSGYFASKTLYEEFLKEALRKGDLRMVRYYYNMILRSNKDPEVCDALDVLALGITSGHVQNAYQVFTSLRWKKSLPPGLETFAKILTRYLRPCVQKDSNFLQRIPPMKELQSGGIEDVLNFAIAESALLPAKWCQSSMENCIALGSFHLAKQIHLYMTSNFVRQDDATSSRVAKMWIKQLGIIANNKMTSRT